MLSTAPLPPREWGTLTPPRTPPQGGQRRPPLSREPPSGRGRGRPGGRRLWGPLRPVPPPLTPRSSLSGGAHGGARGRSPRDAVSSLTHTHADINPPAPRKLLCPDRRAPRAPRTRRHREDPPSLTWRLPGRCLTASDGGASCSRGCFCRHLHSPLPR